MTTRLIYVQFGRNPGSSQCLKKSDTVCYRNHFIILRMEYEGWRCLFGYMLFIGKILYPLFICSFRQEIVSGT